MQSNILFCYFIKKVQLKQQDIFGYGIWVRNYLKTEFVGRGRGMSEKPNGGHRKLDW